MFNRDFSFDVYEPSRDSALARTYRDIREHLLSADGVVMSISHDCDVSSQDKFYLLQEEPTTYQVESRCRWIYGARLLNRLERLLIAQECGCYVAAFRPAIFGEHCNLDHEWVWKRDFSSRGEGVTVCRPPLDSKRVSEGDVLMELIDRAGKTWKLDCFFNVPIACRVLTYNPLQAGQSDSGQEHVSIPQELSRIPACLGHRLAACGCLYYSVDFMRVNGRFAIIELNTSGVGRLDQWVMLRSIYVTNVCSGIVNFVNDDCPKLTLASVAGELSAWRKKTASSLEHPVNRHEALSTSVNTSTGQILSE